MSLSLFPIYASFFIVMIPYACVFIYLAVVCSKSKIPFTFLLLTIILPLTLQNAIQTETMRGIPTTEKTIYKIQRYVYMCTTNDTMHNTIIVHTSTKPTATTTAAVFGSGKATLPLASLFCQNRMISRDI